MSNKQHDLGHRLERLIERAIDLHSVTYQSVAYDKGQEVFTVRCRACSHPVPCPTIAILSEAITQTPVPSGDRDTRKKNE